MRIVSAIVLTAVLLSSPLHNQALAAATPADDRTAAIQQRGTLRVAVLVEYPWLVQRSKREQRFGGPAWRLVEGVAARLKVRIEPIPIRFEDKVAVLNRNEADLTAAPMLITPSRTAQADLIAYSVSAQCFFGRGDNARFEAARTVGDLDRPDLVVAAIAGTPAATWLAGRLPHAGRSIIPGSASDIPVAEVESRRADAATIDKFFVAELLQRSPDLTTLPRGPACLASREMEIPVGVAIAKGQPAFLDLVRTVAQQDKRSISAEEATVLAAGP